MNSTRSSDRALAAVRPDNAHAPFSADAARLAGDNNRFAFDLYARLRAHATGNLFFSPASISTALAAAYAGAAGDTAAEMAEALHFELPPVQLHAAFGELLAGLHAEQPGCQLLVANRLWGSQGYQLLPEYLQTTRTHYAAELAQLDFAQQTEESRQTINDWVAEQTRQRIRNLIAAGALDPTTKLVLTNAVYFKGDWASTFPEEASQQAPFHSSDGHPVEVILMHQEGEFRHAQAEGCQVLELPYAGNDLSMLILLPDKADGLADLEQKLDAEQLAEWIAGLNPTTVDVSLPKFRLTDEFALGDTLHAMGMASAFDPAQADFSGITGSRELFLSEVIHKSFLEVNEQGTEAAAATAIMMRGPSPPTPTFRADHPFVFLIRDNRSGSIVFAGRLTQPDAAK